MAVTTGDELYQVNVSDGTDTVQHPIKDAKAREDIGSLKSALNTEYEKTNEYEIAVTTSAKYSSIGCEIKQGEAYRVNINATGWTAPSSGTYAVILKTSNVQISDSSAFGNMGIDTILAFKKADLNPSGDVHLSIDFIASENAKYLSYYVRSGQATTCDIDIYTLASNINSIKTELNNTITLPRNLFYRRTIYNGSEYSADNYHVSSKELFFSEPTLLVSSALMQVFYASGNYTGFSNKILIPSNTYAVIVLTSTSGADIDNLQVLSTADGVDKLKGQYLHKITETFRIGGNMKHYGGLYMANGADRGMMHQYGTNLKNVSVSPVLYAERDTVIYMSRYYNAVAYVASPNGGSLIAQINQEEKAVIPSGTEFVVTFTSDYSGDNTELGSNAIFAIKADDSISSYALAFNTTINADRVDCAFIDNNGVMYYIDRTNLKYYTVENGTISATTALDGAVGHANNCNYIDGNVYVSDWTTKDLIHVFSVNETTKTLTYVKDISIPVAEDDGATEYFVYGDENQIASIGMTLSSTAMKYTLWVKTGNTYTPSKTIIIPMMDEQANWIQGFTMVGNFAIYIMGKDNYKHLGFGILDVATGVVTYIPTASVLSDYEIEALIPTENNLFMAIDVHGKQFTQYIK